MLWLDLRRKERGRVRKKAHSRKKKSKLCLSIVMLETNCPLLVDCRYSYLDLAIDYASAQHLFTTWAHECIIEIDWLLSSLVSVVMSWWKHEVQTDSQVEYRVVNELCQHQQLSMRMPVEAASGPRKYPISQLARLQLPTRVSVEASSELISETQCELRLMNVHIQPGLRTVNGH